MKKICVIILGLLFTITLVFDCYAEEDATAKILKSGLLGAGTGAIAAGASGGKAGKGALIGAGTGIIGSVLLDAITGGGSKQRRQRYEDEEYEDGYYDEEYYEEPQQDANSKILKNGLVGAGTGAIAAGVSGGKAGQGALIGAGTGVIGNVLLDTISKPSQAKRRRRPRKIAVKEEPEPQEQKTKIIRKYDENGNLVYEEIIPVE